MLGDFSNNSFADFFSSRFQKNIFAIDLPSEFRTGLIQLRHDIDMSCLSWIKIVNKDYQQTTLRGKGLKKNMMVRNSKNYILTLYLIEAPFGPFANIEDPDQAALVRAA